jgi:hypothetical protein
MKEKKDEQCCTVRWELRRTTSDISKKDAEVTGAVFNAWRNVPELK